MHAPPELHELMGFLQEAFRRGVLILGAGRNAIRLAPPLVFTRDQADSVLGIFDDVLTRSVRL